VSPPAAIRITTEAKIPLPVPRTRTARKNATANNSVASHLPGPGRAGKVAIKPVLAGCVIRWEVFIHNMNPDIKRKQINVNIRYKRFNEPCRRVSMVQN